MSTSGIGELRRRIEGRVVTPGQPSYEKDSRLFNAAIESRPAVIVYCATAADVATTLHWSQSHELALSVRSGGCCVTGFSTNDGGVVLDVSSLDRIEVDRAGRSVRVQAGVELGRLYRELNPHGLVVPGGECPMVGVSGLTLGGGVSLLGRSLGFTVDNLIEARMITAAGESVLASDASHPDLFWALRGGGGSFGVVTELTFELSPLPEKVLAGMMVWTVERAAEALFNSLEYFRSEAPDELDGIFVLATMPDTGAAGLGLVLAYNGAPDAGEKAAQRLQDLARPEKVHIEPVSYYRFLDGSFHAPRRRVYELWKSGFVEDPLPESTLELLVDRFQNRPSPESFVGFELCGGAMNRVKPDATAFVHRDQDFLLSIFANSTKEQVGNRAWAKALYRDMQPHLSGSHYQNYPDLELEDWRRGYYGANYERLLTIKRRYDPDNVFRFAQSIGS